MRSFLFVLYLNLYHNIIMKERKYTLPRHTNLAGNGQRTGAFLVDLGIWALLSVSLLFLCFIPVFKSTLNKVNDTFDGYRLDSHLFYKDESGEIDFVESDASFDEYNECLTKFYLTYIPYESPDKDLPVTLSSGEEVAKNEYFVPKWYNQTVLKIDTDGKNLFMYQLTSGEPDVNKIGVIKDGADLGEVNRFMQSALLKAMNNDFNSLPTVNKALNELEFYNQLTIVLSILPAGMVVYILIPWILGDGQTVGKKVFGLGLATNDGYKFKSPMLLMRFVPVLVSLLALFIPIWSDLILIFLVYLIIFLVSFTLSMASPKKAALHDFCARSIVVDLKSSILFETSVEEEKYIAEEDNIVLDNEDSSEEPEISYEK